MNKILLYEQNTFFKNSLLRIIESRFPDVVTKSVLSRKECLAAINTFEPDILLMGLNAYNGSDLSLIDHINQASPGVNILLFVDYNIDEYRREAILKGASHIIPRELWTGNEILALINTILTSKECLKHFLAEGSSIDQNILEQPMERRKKSRMGREIEREFLVHHPDRRKEKEK